MTEILDIISNIVLLPYHIMKAVLMYLFAHVILLIVLISVILITFIVILAIFPGFFLKAILGFVALVAGYIIGIVSLLFAATGALAFLGAIGAILIILMSVGGVGIYIARDPNWKRIVASILLAPFIGPFFLGWTIGEFIEDSFRKPDFQDFANKIGGIMTAYDGKGASDRHRAAIAIKPGSKYYGLALTMMEKDDINKTDSGKFWATQEIPDTLFLFKPAYDNLNLAPFDK